MICGFVGDLDEVWEHARGVHHSRGHIREMNVAGDEWCNVHDAWASDCEGLIVEGDRTRFRCVEEAGHVHKWLPNPDSRVTNFLCKCGLDTY